ncbi:ATP-binding protein [Intrasporangium sp.]|uniref:ATP-binding protein n=1 Tax=Intrasporangium sp. TaxID=1925024 RepID=UPI00293A3E15|nr:ATP-binding protein [Intrasporangium sp.]MDV3221002.1 ATP-binding protein [Intrasporangium sp.]
MDPITNPYAPGAGQRPPELAGRDEQLRTFDVVLERIARGRSERSIVLTGLRGVGKTVLLNALRSSAVRADWGTGKLEARPDQRLRRPLAAAAHQAVRELGHPRGVEVDHVLGIIKSFALRDAPSGAKLRDRWQPGIDVPAVAGRADSGDIEIDLVELFTDIGGLAADLGKGVAFFVDEMQDLGPEDVSAVCAACHEISQSGLPVIVVGAGLPHLPAVLSASKSYSERLFRYQRIDRLPRDAADRALVGPAAEEGCEFTTEALEAMYAVTAGYPYFIQAYGKVVWDVAPTSPISAEDIRVAAPEAESELAVGFFGSRFERATPAEREYLRAMADAALVRSNGTQHDDQGRDGLEASPAAYGIDDELDAVATSSVADLLGRKPQSLSPARDSLIKKGLIYSGERGQIAFTVPHFGRYLRTHG